MNYKKITLMAVAAIALGVTAQAHALSVLIQPGQAFSTYSGVATIDFGTSVATDAGPVVPGGTGVTVYSTAGATFKGGALYNLANSPIDSVTARPVGSVSNFWSVGTSPMNQTGPGLLSLTTGVQYIGFLWGSPDNYNTVSFYNGATLLGSFTGPAPANGDQSASSYFNAYAGAGEQITSVTFASTKNALETDNFAYSVTAVPEPESYAMMLAGLGLMGAIARRRSKSKSV